jgi:hypothetical protein
MSCNRYKSHKALTTPGRRHYMLPWHDGIMPYHNDYGSATQCLNALKDRS